MPPSEKSTIRDAAGKAFGIAGRTVDYASQVLRDGDDLLVKAVDHDKIAVSTAAEISKLPKEQQREEVKQPKTRTEYRNEHRKEGQPMKTDFASKTTTATTTKNATATKTRPEPTETYTPQPIRYPCEHRDSELFATSKAKVSIAQLKGIPADNRYRDAAFQMVVDWVNQSRSDSRKKTGTAVKRSLNHLLTIAKRGKHPGSSGCEKQARKLVTCILNNAIGLDDEASSGIAELMNLVQANPQRGTELVRDAIAWQRRAAK